MKRVYDVRNKSVFGLFRYSVVSLLIFLSVFVSMAFLIYVWTTCSGPDCKALDYFALNPLNIASGKYFWTIVTHMFIHGGLVHLFVNMFVLFSLGGLCEKIIGRKRFLWFYLISGVSAGILSVLMSYFFGYGFLEKVFGAPETYMVGASGAIFGIAGLFVVLLPKIRFSIIFLPFFSLPAYLMVPLALVLTWIATVVGGFGIGNVAHLGGFLAGVFYGYYLRTKYGRKIQMLQRYFR